MHEDEVDAGLLPVGEVKEIQGVRFHTEATVVVETTEVHLAVIEAPVKRVLIFTQIVIPLKVSAVVP